MSKKPTRSNMAFEESVMGCVHLQFWWVHWGDGTADRSHAVSGSVITDVILIKVIPHTANFAHQSIMIYATSPGYGVWQRRQPSGLCIVISSKLDMCTLSCMVCCMPRSRTFHPRSNACRSILQIHAAHFVVGAGVREDMTPVLKTLHWLPIHQQRSLYRCTEHFIGRDPVTIADVLQLYHPDCFIWSASDELVLVVPRCRTMLGDKAFSTHTFAPTLWNSLPTGVRVAFWS